MIILGAGLSGCIAGFINKDSILIESSKNKDNIRKHQAVLRFRSDNIGKITNIQFKKVKVIKSIWNGKDCLPTPRIISQYSKKVSNKYLIRSISNIDSVDRYIAPDNFHELLLKELDSRIVYDFKINSITKEHIMDNGENGFNGIIKRKNIEPIISTLPINVNASFINEHIVIDKNVTKIYVNTFTIKNCDMCATIYYPDENISIYRASVTGDKLIIESMDMLFDSSQLEYILYSFGIKIDDISSDLTYENYCQQNGKMTNINEFDRQSIIAKLTLNHNIYSLGRFAVWKNILLDEVLDDLFIINKLISKNHYQLLKHQAKGK